MKDSEGVEVEDRTRGEGSVIAIPKNNCLISSAAFRPEDPERPWVQVGGVEVVVVF